jgi:ATP-dependent RNA helicase RhlE
MTVREPAQKSAGNSQGFRSFQLGDAIQRGIEAAGFTEPRPIQQKTIGPGLAGRDVLGLAQTGTGKTAAFGLPILAAIGGRRAGPPSALIVAPTRELTQQIAAELELLGRFTKVRIATIIGGVAQGNQVRALAAKPEIVVACPGRLLDLYEQGHVKLNEVQTLVLDEADHMFDMGFLPSIKKIVRALPKRRQNLLFSATMPKELRKLADEILVDPVVVELSNSKPTETVSHALFPVDEATKLDLLVHIFETEKPKSAIVFTRTKHRAKRMAEKLAKLGLKAVALQGNMSQGQRERAMEGFRAGRMDVLVATDIAARGIDVAAVSHVINFDLPTTPEAYTHRIGRTGRAERTGVAYTFVVPDDADGVKAIEKLLGSPIERRYVEGLSRKRAGERGAAAGKDRASTRSELDDRPPRPDRREREAAQRTNSGGRGSSGKFGPRTSNGRSSVPASNKRGTGARGAAHVAQAMGRGVFAKAPTPARSEPKEPALPFGAGVPAVGEAKAREASSAAKPKSDVRGERSGERTSGQRSEGSRSERPSGSPERPRTRRR